MFEEQQNSAFFIANIDNTSHKKDELQENVEQINIKNILIGPNPNIFRKKQMGLLI